MSVIFPESLKSVLSGRTLEVDQARRAMGSVIDGGPSTSQIGAFVAALALRGPTCDELVGFGQAARERCARAQPLRTPLLEISGTCPIATAASFIAAAAGAALAQQVSPDAEGILEALGITIGSAPAVALRCVDDAGLGFFSSAVFHPELRSVLSLRGEFGVRTVFDLLEPLANPAGAQRQVVGAYAAGLVPILAKALQALGSESVLVVHSRDGLDAFSLAAPAAVAHLREGRIEEYEMDAAALGLKRRPGAALPGGDAASQAKSLISILKGERGPAFDSALLNTAAGLIAAGKAGDFKEALALAEEAVDSCRALEVLEKVKKLSSP